MEPTLRASTETDLKDLDVSLAQDEYHKGQTAAQWAAPNGELMTFFDAEGILYHIRIEKLVRVHFQQNKDASGLRLARGMKEGILWLKKAARDSGHREIIFNSTVEKLKKFFEPFGFKPSPEENKVIL